jgi:phage-related protein
MPEAVRRSFGLELMRVQFGGEPTSFKPMSTVGTGAYEIRVRDESGAYRAIYMAKFEAPVYVLHAFHNEDAADSKDGHRASEGPIQAD